MTPDVVVMGGTFDPVHNGHLSVLRQVLNLTGGRTGLLVPAGIPNLRGPAVASAAARLAMLQAAIRGDARLAVSDIELDQPGIAYTVDTLARLRAAQPGLELALLLGVDAARGVRHWHRWQALLAEGSFIVVNRAGEPAPALEELLDQGWSAERTLIVQVSSPPVSATEIRRRVAAGESIDGLVPAPVARIIEHEQLYRGGPARA